MKIGEVAARLGTTTRTLRFYEERGLVTPRRSAAGTRRYDEQDLERFRTVLTLAAAGMALADIEVLARVWRESRRGDQAAQTASLMLERLCGEVQVRRKGLERLEADVKRAQAVVTRCLQCATPDTEACRRCATTIERDGVQIMGLIWEKPIR